VGGCYGATAKGGLPGALRYRFLRVRTCEHCLVNIAKLPELLRWTPPITEARRGCGRITYRIFRTFGIDGVF